jgi:hypothetical protein
VKGLFVCLDRSASDMCRQKTNQCHLLVFFIIIGLTRSKMLQCFLYTSCSSKDWNSEANRKRQERRLVDRICHLCRDTQWTRTPMRSTGKTHHLASKRTPEPPQHTGDPPLPPPQVQWAQICFHLQGIYLIYKSTYPHIEHIQLQRHVNTTRRLAQWWRQSIPCSGSRVRLPSLIVFFEFEFIKPWRQQVTRKPSSPTGWMEMEKGPTGTRDT